MLTSVLNGLGFHPLPLIKDVPAEQSRMRISAESIGDFNADMIVTTYVPETGGTPQSVFRDLDRTARGYQGFLKAYATKRIYSFSREEVYPTSFTGAQRLLDHLGTMAAK